MALSTIQLETKGEAFYDITQEVRSALSNFVLADSLSGMLYLFITHTSCALTISEAYDPLAAKDLEKYLDHLAPRSLDFIEHTTEGPDDSPSHMKSLLLQPSLNFFIESGELILGQWQGIYLAEFRDAPKIRKILVKFVAD
ncbi:MAG: YjbQ family protein [Halobacteriovoraceae bacterium]|jgi:secondary thiamine-phosphate synthase enzyme|nr:YjbQ family protein [Halobacteriovoraceae bacterium]MBT5093346.1 YjbQ family protein [Halobacteriovoraceae bacterium]